MEIINEYISCQWNKSCPWQFGVLSSLTSLCFCITAWKVSKYGVFSCPNFPVFGLNTEIYFVKCPNTKFFLVGIFLYLELMLIQSKCRKIRTRKTPYSDTFHYMSSMSFNCLIVCNESKLCLRYQLIFDQYLSVKSYFQYRHNFSHLSSIIGLLNISLHRVVTWASHEAFPWFSLFATEKRRIKVNSGEVNSLFYSSSNF